VLCSRRLSRDELHAEFVADIQAQFAEEQAS
jgi:hypothetical protein